jgi:hypothetical protein
MSDEKRCDCCKRYWYVDDLISGLCPNCLDFLATKNQMDIEQDQRIKELERRLSNCIEPKFKVGQEVWHCFKNCNEPDKTIIDWIDVEITENFIDFTYYDVDGFGFDEIMLFTTEEEAMKYLEELKK